jgi:beta-galactosidase/beta-glucuronidase
MIRDNMTLLDGPWEFYFDDRQTPGWNPGDADVQTIQVPYSYHTKASGIEDTTEHTHMAYRRILTIDPLEDERLHLVFEGVDHESFVYLNNQLVHHNIGGYHRFQIDITDHVHPGDNVASNATPRTISNAGTSKPPASGSRSGSNGPSPPTSRVSI